MLCSRVWNKNTQLTDKNNYLRPFILYLFNSFSFSSLTPPLNDMKICLIKTGFQSEAGQIRADPLWIKEMEDDQTRAKSPREEMREGLGH